MTSVGIRNLVFLVFIFSSRVDCRWVAPLSPLGDVVQIRSPSNCSDPPLDPDQRLWREDPRGVRTDLNLGNIACHLEPTCPHLTNLTEEFKNAASPPLKVELQESDGLVLSVNRVFDSDFVNETNVTVTLHMVSTHESELCDSFPLPSETLAKWTLDLPGNVTFDTELLPPGIHILRVQATIPGIECTASWTLNVTLSSSECIRLPGAEVCSGIGACVIDSSKVVFTCQCCPGYVGRYCEERDGCYDNPCLHGGFCVDITEGLNGNTYQCLCPHGYSGAKCEEMLNQCDRNPCLNDGVCQGNQTWYKCLCPSGYTGRDCETNMDECISNPCVHGVCEDGVGTYKCYCLPGYGGDHCEFEYDECDSSPCINGGVCEDLVAGYRCHCGPGYQGRRCQIKLDLCQPNPCPSPAQCVDRGNNYSCICHPGFNGCTQHYDPCYPNPCQNGGSCWPSLDSFFCSCRPGYTGDSCEERYLDQSLTRTAEDTSVHRGGDAVGPVSVPLDHLHNIYIAAATLAGACLIVVAVVTACHCRVHKTYRHITNKLGRQGNENQYKLEDPVKFLWTHRGSAFEDGSDGTRTPLIG
ncbi:delta and Notch-like epidermal growth factor-related receptor isoform X2 [Centruroides vittatus]|uniref:delta and Notch-like epidermal growth factor-related receptor isoform X2 n=1 Tax=Centruroides vittatus TaxID=120091 RepID=UPI00350F5572